MVLFDKLRASFSGGAIPLAFLTGQIIGVPMKVLFQRAAGSGSWPPLFFSADYTD